MKESAPSKSGYAALPHEVVDLLRLTRDNFGMGVKGGLEGLQNRRAGRKREIEEQVE